MTPETFLKVTRETALYPRESAILYLTCGLASEAGEVAGKVKKALRGDYGDAETNDARARGDMLAEIGDVLWYTTRLLDELGMTLGDAMEACASKLLDRSARGVIRGSGDHR